MSDKVFIYDDVLLILNTGKVLTGYSLKIKFKRPDGTSGNWPASIDTVTTRMRAVVNFDMVGIWKVQSFAYVAGEKYHGMFRDVKVYEAIAFDTTAAPTTAVPTTMVPTT